jgi:shikimate kinase
MTVTSVFLVGPMGAGKSTIGRRLARRMGFAFFDVDRVLEERTGADIPLIFELEGEDGFRSREKALLDELTLQSKTVVATGGGAVLDADNRCRLKSRGFVVYLKTSIDEQLRRLAHDRQRPLLQTPDRRERLESLRRERELFYQEVADLVLETDRQRIHRVVQQIARRYAELDGQLATGSS